MSDPHPLVLLAHARGNHPSDLRDAAHEAFHALSVGLEEDWDRETIHEALVERFGGAELWLHELQARAVEQLVCAEFGVETNPIEHWVHWSILEAIKFRQPVDMNFDRAVKTTRRLLDNADVKRWAKKIGKLNRPRVGAATHRGSNP